MNTYIFEEKKIAYYPLKGEGLPLVFVHGFCEDSSVWDEILKRFPDRNIIRIDLPGFGQSEQIKDYSIPRFAQMVYELLDSLNIKACIYIGHSMGGYVGLELAKNNGHILKGFCLFHSHPYADTPDKKLHRRKSIDFIQENGHIYYVKQLFPALFTKSYMSSHHLELAKMVFKASKYEATNIIAGLEMMMSRADNTAVLEHIECPVLFIIGKEDTIVPAYLSDTALPNIASIQVMKKVAHMGMLESPKKCEVMIKDFIKLVNLQ